LAEDRRGQDEILEAWCEVISEGAAWDEAAEVAERARRHAARAGEPPLALYAMRLEGRAAAARDDPARAGELLSSAADGFTELEAIWEAAVTGLDVAHLLVTSGENDRARSVAEESASVFEKLGSVRELSLARDLLGDPT